MLPERASRPALALCLLLLFPALGFGPCGPIPGGALAGSTTERRVDDWTFVNDLSTCAVEVRPDDPRSVTVNCMAYEGRLFVSCSRCEGKTWSAIALRETRGRVRVGDEVHAVALERVLDPALLDAVWAARLAKLGDDPAPRPEGWWTFELASR
ncbi:MAG: hypothetical protein AAGC67_15130 [Myxococcota bacterium]